MEENKPLFSDDSAEEGAALTETEHTHAVADDADQTQENIARDIPDGEMEEVVLPPKKPWDAVPFLNRLFDLFELFAVATAVILVCFTFLFRMSIVDGGSMEPTLHSGDRLIMSSLYFEPKVGDIVILQPSYDLKYIHDPENENQKSDAGFPIIKRVIAVAGDEVRVTKSGIVYVNGVCADGGVGDYQTLYDGFMPSFPEELHLTVSEGCVFLAGDHRTNSKDSRYFGEVDIRFIQGVALWRIFPLSSFGGL